MIMDYEVLILYERKGQLKIDSGLASWFHGMYVTHYWNEHDKELSMTDLEKERYALLKLAKDQTQLDGVGKVYRYNDGTATYTILREHQ